MFRCILTIALLLMAPVIVSAQQGDNLRGIAGMRVLVESLPSDAASAGLNVDQVQADTELRLRKYGVKVLPESSHPATPYLYINITVAKNSSNNIFAVAVDLEFNRAGTFGSDKNLVETFASVWSRSAVILASDQHAKRMTRELLADLVDQFINDYLAANPKP